jgi:hypothetical protein
MKFWSSLRTATEAVFHRRSVEREMEDEFRSHLEIRIAHLERQGLPRTEAKRRARIEFGGYQKYKEECHEALGTPRLDILWSSAEPVSRNLAIGLIFGAALCTTLSYLLARWTELRSLSAPLLALATAVLIVVGILATLLPAMRASKTKPMDILRLDP